MKKEILYIGGFKLPDRDAGAIRVRAVADSLNAAGYPVKLAGDDHLKPADAHRSLSTMKRMTAAAHRGLDFFITSSSYSAHINAIDWNRTAAVIFYPGSAALLWRLMHSCRRHGVPMIVDCVEWFDLNHVMGGRCGPFALESELRMRWLQIRARNVICISSFLEQYYGERDCNVVRIPPLLGKEGCEYPLDPVGIPDLPPSHVSLVYAGVPGRKELLGEIVKAVKASRQCGINVSLRIVGITKSELLMILERDGYELGSLEGITCYGRLPHKDAVQAIIQSDFTVILRKQQRFANAGFPSKLVESLSLGVPAIANATSDIADYLQDGQQGYLLEEPTAACLGKAIVRASSRNSEEKREMRKRARALAHQGFAYLNYVDVLARFLSEARPCG